MSGTTFPPDGPTSLLTVIRSYLYAQYTDDDALQTFVAAQNFLTQKWVDDFNNLNLPVYSMLSGQLLDWVARGLYGLTRPILSIATRSLGGYGPYNTIEYDALAYNEGVMQGLSPASYRLVNDDEFKRIITWHVYKGDGFQFTTNWLKRRVHRFLTGANGYLALTDNTYDVSIICSGTNVEIRIPESGEIATTLQYAVYDGVLNLPFQYAFDVAFGNWVDVAAETNVAVSADVVFGNTHLGQATIGVTTHVTAVSGPAINAQVTIGVAAAVTATMEPAGVVALPGWAGRPWASLALKTQDLP